MGQYHITVNLDKREFVSPHSLGSGLNAEAKPGDPVLDVLNRLYRRLSPKDQLLCRVELFEVRAAKRGERIAS